MLRVAGVTAMAATALGACGGGPSYTGTPASTWMTTLCRSLSGYQTTLASGTKSFEAAAPTYASLAAAKAGLVNYVNSAIGATDAVIANIKGAGNPAVKDGPQIAQAFQTGLGQVRAAFAQAETQAVGIPTTDATAFEHTAQSINTELSSAATQAGQTFSGLDKNYPAPQLNDAARHIKACAVLFPKSG